MTYWKNIIGSCTDNYDLLQELLPNEGLFESLFNFSTKAEAIKLKIKSFERVCFLIYSGQIDKYENKLKMVVESLSEIMNLEKPSSALLIPLLFCVRILFIRLSQSSLNRLFRYIWPGLITLLVEIFTKEHFLKNTNLLLAGLKVIEQAAKLAAVSVTEELLELYETSFPMTMMKGLVVTAG